MSKLYCPNCGREVESTWKVCPYCGYDLTKIPKNKEQETESPSSSLPPIPPPPKYNQPTYTPPKKSHKGIITTVIVIVLIIILVPLIFWYVAPHAGVDITTGAIRVIYHSILHNDVKFFIDGQYKGEYPSDEYVTFHGISPGEHTVRATTVGGVFLDEKTVNVNPGETVTVELSYLG